MTEYIAIFDSGVGGITVLQKALKLLPCENYIYYSDKNFAPYGTLSAPEILTRTELAIQFLNKFPLKAFAIACNTATSACIGQLRTKYTFPVIGMEPAVKPAITAGGPGKVIISATPFTLREKKLKLLIESLNAQKHVELVDMHELVTYAEHFDFDMNKIGTYIAQKLDKFDLSAYKAMVLGCTHFSFFKDQFESYLPKHIAIHDGNTGTVRHLARTIRQNDHGTHSLLYFDSGMTKNPSVIYRFLNYLEAIDY